MFVKIGRLINLYFIIIIAIQKNATKTLYKYCILKLNVHEIKLNLHSKIANFNYKVLNCKCIKMKYLVY